MMSGYGGCHRAINNAGVLLMLGTDFPFPGITGAGEVGLADQRRRSRRRLTWAERYRRG